MTSSSSSSTSASSSSSNARVNGARATSTSARRSVAVLGAGKLGAAVAALLGQAGHEVVVWARNASSARALTQAAPSSVRMRSASTIGEACKGASLIAFAVPATALRDVARAAGEVADGSQIALHACRGVDAEFALPHQIIRAESCLKKIGALGGPLYLDDAERGRPLVAVVASRFDEVHRALKALVAHTHVRLHTTHDVVGVEVAGALSNVAQIAAGMAEGLGLGETDQGILLTRGLIEATRVGCALGAERVTFQGLAGVGDLIPRPVTTTKRHRALGVEIGGGRNAASATSSHADLEGLRTVREARALGERLELSLPLVSAVDDVLNAGKAPAEALERVLSLDLDLEGA